MSMLDGKLQSGFLEGHKCLKLIPLVIRWSAGVPSIVQNPVNEDIALTPYLFGVSMNGIVIKIFGIGLCWLHYSVYLGIGFNVPKNYPTFKILRLKDKT